MDISQELLDWAHHNDVVVQMSTLTLNGIVFAEYDARSKQKALLRKPENWATGSTIDDALRMLRDKIGNRNKP